MAVIREIAYVMIAYLKTGNPIFFAKYDGGQLFYPTTRLAEAFLLWHPTVDKLQTLFKDFECSEIAHMIDFSRPAEVKEITLVME